MSAVSRSYTVPISSSVRNADELIVPKKILHQPFWLSPSSLNGGEKPLSGISHKIPPSAEARVEFEIYDGVGVDVML